MIEVENISRRVTSSVSFWASDSSTPSAAAIGWEVSKLISSERSAFIAYDDAMATDDSFMECRPFMK